MAYRCLEKIKIDGQIVNLMQINNVANAVSAGSGWAVGISNSYIASQGDNFLDIFDVGWITDNTVYTKYVDGSNAVLTNYAQSQGGSLYNWVTFDVSNLTTTRAETGYLNPSGQYGADHIYWGIAIDDDIQEGVLFTGIAKGTATGNLYMYNNDSNKRKDIYNAFKTPKQGGGAGSGYIGNSLLSNKKMVGYNVPTSSAESTKTESVNVYSASGESNKPKAGDGKVKIKLVRQAQEKTLEQVIKYPITQYDTLSASDAYYFPFSSVDGDNSFWGGNSKRPLQYDAENGYYYFAKESNYGEISSAFGFSIPRQYVKSVSFKALVNNPGNVGSAFGFSIADTVTEFGDDRFWCNYNSNDIPVVNVPNTGVYYDFTVEVNRYADYLVFYAIRGAWQMKNFKGVFV